MPLSKRDKSMIAQAYRLIISCILSIHSGEKDIFDKFKRANEQFENTLNIWENENEKV